MYAKRYRVLFKFTILMMSIHCWYAWIITCVFDMETANSLYIVMAILGHSCKHRCSFVYSLQVWRLHLCILHVFLSTLTCIIYMYFTCFHLQWHPNVSYFNNQFVAYLNNLIRSQEFMWITHCYDILLQNNIFYSE